MGLAAGIFEFFLTLFDQIVAFLLSAFQRVLRLIPGLLGLGLRLLQLDLKSSSWDSTLSRRLSSFDM